MNRQAFMYSFFGAKLVFFVFAKASLIPRNRCHCSFFQNLGPYCMSPWCISQTTSDHRQQCNCLMLPASNYTLFCPMAVLSRMSFIMYIFLKKYFFLNEQIIFISNLFCFVSVLLGELLLNWMICDFMNSSNFTNDISFGL